jgi:hypothetical protein
MDLSNPLRLAEGLKHCALSADSNAEALRHTDLRDSLRSMVFSSVVLATTYAAVSQIPDVEAILSLCSLHYQFNNYLCRCRLLSGSQTT